VDDRGQALLGRSIPRLEDRPFLTGLASFVDDLAPPGHLHAAFLRSPVARGRIGSVEAADALALAGVEGVFAASDLALPPLVSPCEWPGAYSPPQPLLADGVVRFVGEPIAVVVATSRYVAEDAVELVGLELEPLEALADAGRTLSEGPPRLHENGSDLYFESRLETGDLDGAFERAAAVVTRTFRHGRVSAAPLEPRGLVAAPDGDGICLWSSTQGPHKLRLAVSAALGLERDRVRVICPDVGGGFGQKAHVYAEELVVAALAHRLGRPVKWVEDRVENLTASSHARNQSLSVRAAAAADGTLLALEVDQTVDQGAYGSYPHGSMLEAQTTSGLLPGPYRLDSVRLHARAVATSKCPQGAYRGVGFVVAAWVHERVLDVLAAELGLDRAEIRRRNLLTPDELPFETATRQRYDSGDYRRALELALEAIGYDSFRDEQLEARRDGRLIGLGISCYVEPTGMNSMVFKRRGMVGIEGFDGAHVSLDREGKATAWTTTPALGQGVTTTFTQLVAAALGLPLDQVRVARSDTAVGDLTGTGTFASRSAVSGGGALAAAAAEIRARLLDDAAEKLEAATGDLELADGVVRVAGSPEAAITVAELARTADPDRYRWSAHYDPPAVAYPYATHACVVEVDPGTGGAHVRRYVVAEDCGRVINPAIVEGQIHGATAQGIAEALHEEIAYDEQGQLLTASLMDYLLPTAGETPRLEILHLETPSPTSPGGAKGIGEGGTIGAPAAIANAVCDALGVELNELPLKPEQIQAAAALALAATETPEVVPFPAASGEGASSRGRPR
jgi:carbon-monoxide dehydrogenase large subunit